MSLPAKEREAAVRYYGNYFDDAGLSNEQDVIASLGSPENLAHKILNNSNKLSLTVKKTKKEVKAVRQKLNSRQKIIAVAMLVIVAVLREKYGYARSWMGKQILVFRWTVWIALFIIVLILGSYGPGYNASEFIYQGF